MPTSLGPAEILIILVVALIVLGPKRLPEAGRQVGRALAEVKKWSNGLQSEIRDVLETDPVEPPASSGPAPTVLTGGPGPPLANEIPTEKPPSEEHAAPSGPSAVAERPHDVPGSTIPTNGSVTDDPSRN